MGTPWKSARNLAVVFAADGTQVAEYEKRHLLPGPETGYRAGATAATIGEGLGVAICKDLDFVDVGRDSALAGARTLLVPAWDFDSDARFHARIAIARGVESGFAVARSAARGLLTASDGYGRIVAEARSGAREPAVLVVSLPAGPGPTFFARQARLPALLIGALLSLLLALALRRRPTALQT